MIIKQKDFDFLCKSCDSILNKGDKEYRIANDWLHVIRPHPIYFNKYYHIFRRDLRIKFYLYLSKSLFLYLTLILYRLIKSLTKFSKQKLLNKASKIDSVFVSHLLNKDQLNDIEDFYFNKIPQVFSCEKQSITLLINHTKKSFNAITGINNRVVIPNISSFLEEFKISVILISDAIRILKLDEDYRIKLTSAVESLSPSTAKNIRIGLFTKKVVKLYKPKYVFTTYEGHAWERLIYGFSKKLNKDTINVGYQHALIFNNQHSIMRRLNKGYNPDYILCSGEMSYKKFISSNFLQPNRILLLGSNRAFIENSSILNKKRNNTFLVLPEGDLLECLPLVDFTILLSKSLRNLNFIIRTHPITDRKKLLKLRPILKESRKNLEFSNNSFDHDLDRSSFAIYRGSTSIIKAIQKGLYPLYYKINNEMNINPLDVLNDQVPNISSPDELYKILSKNNLNNQEYLIEQVKSYFSPFNFGQLKKI